MAGYKVKIDNIEFHCYNRSSIEDLYDVLFSYSTDRKILYERIGVDTRNAVLLDSVDEIKDNTNIKEGKFIDYIRALKVLQQEYGEKYDPEMQVISVFDPGSELAE